MEYENLRPLGIGEILDSALRIYRSRFGALVAAVAFVVVPLHVVQFLFQISQPTTHIVRSQGQVFESSGPSAGTTLALLVVTVLVSLFTTAFAQGASMRIIADQYLGTETSWSASLRGALRQFRSLIWVAILAGLSWVVGGFLCVIPGVFAYVLFSVSIPALLMEGNKGTKALGRSRTLVIGRWWPTFAALLVIFLLTFVLTSLASLVVGGTTILTRNASPSTGVRAIQSAITTLITVFTTPMTAAVATVIYFDLRVRKEGFDIALMVQRLAPVTAPIAPVGMPTTPQPTPPQPTPPPSDLSWSAPATWPAPAAAPPPRRSPWADAPPPDAPPVDGSPPDGSPPPPPPA